MKKKFIAVACALLVGATITESMTTTSTTKETVTITVSAGTTSAAGYTTVYADGESTDNGNNEDKDEGVNDEKTETVIATYTFTVTTTTNGLTATAKIVDYAAYAKDHRENAEVEIYAITYGTNDTQGSDKSGGS